MGIVENHLPPIHSPFFGYAVGVQEEFHEGVEGVIWEMELAMGLVGKESFKENSWFKWV